MSVIIADTHTSPSLLRLPSSALHPYKMLASMQCLIGVFDSTSRKSDLVFSELYVSGIYVTTSIYILKTIHRIGSALDVTSEYSMSTYSLI